MGGGDGGAGAIAAQNKKTQALINQGMNSLNSIFWGGTYGTDPVNSPIAGGMYYDPQGNPLNQQSQDFQAYYKGLPDDTAFNKWKHDNPKTRGKPPEHRPDQNTAFLNYEQGLAGSGSLYGGKKTSTGFDNNFYNQAQNAYLDFATPQLNQQFNQTNRQLQYKLGNQGLFGGSAASDLQNQLGNELSTQRINLANNALNQTNQLRQNVTGQYNTLVGQLEASANPSATTQQALQTASTFSQPSALPAVGQLFNNYANTYLAGLNQNTYGNMGLNNQYQNQQQSVPQVPVVTAK